MIDATKLARPARATASSGQGASDVQRPTAGAAKIDAAGGQVDQIATYPAKNLVLDNGRYYANKTEK